MVAHSFISASPSNTTALLPIVRRKVDEVGNMSKWRIRVAIPEDVLYSRLLSMWILSTPT